MQNAEAVRLIYSQLASVMHQNKGLKAICDDGGYNGSSTVHVIKEHGIDMIISTKSKHFERIVDVTIYSPFYLGLSLGLRP